MDSKDHPHEVDGKNEYFDMIADVDVDEGKNACKLDDEHF